MCIKVLVIIFLVPFLCTSLPLKKTSAESKMQDLDKLMDKSYSDSGEKIADGDWNRLDSQEETVKDTDSETSNMKHKEKNEMLASLQKILSDFHEKQLEYEDIPQIVEMLDTHLDNALSEFYDKYLDKQRDVQREVDVNEIKEEESNGDSSYSDIFEEHEKEEKMQKDMPQVSFCSLFIVYFSQNTAQTICEITIYKC